MSYTIYCKVCKIAVGVGDGEPPEGDHYCSMHVPEDSHATEGHPYEGARIEAKPPLQRAR